MGTQSFYGLYGKRFLDVIGSGLGLSILAVPMLAIAFLIRLTMGRPVLFRQTRPGRGGEPFELVKFRTMRAAEADSPGGDTARITPVGGFLRRTSLDELPELWNVLKGEMSLVGPRPLLMEYLPLYDETQRRRHDVRPGITGLAQVSGRNGITWSEKFALDVAYVERVTSRMDARILARTIWQVIRPSGIDAGGEETMPRFTGNVG